MYDGHITMTDDLIQAENAVSTKIQREAQPLFATRLKVYPRAVRGLYRRIKWAVLGMCLAVYYLVPFVRWDRGPSLPDQAVLIDLPNRRAYFLWIEIWPQEVYYLTGLLIMAAFALFLATSLLGRVWCGYACPQTVWTDLFMAVERLIEGDRNARMRIDKQAWHAGKIGKKLLKHTVWLLIALVTGGAWIMYFQDAPRALAELFSGEASTTIYFFVGLFTATTYVLAGWAREQVCTYMCPWPRFQAAMLDENSLVVSYRAWRGEQRGKHKKGESWQGRGDCVDCNSCVAVCPTGIDIRDGQQLECIACGLCIDACDEIMDKVGRPRRLIGFDTLANLAAQAQGKRARVRLIRPRTMIYAALLTVVAAIMAGAMLTRSTLELSILRDRSPLFVQLSDGEIQNAYTLKVLNKTHEAVRYAISIENLANAQIAIVGDETHSGTIAVGTDSVGTFRVLVRAPRGSITRHSVAVHLRLVSLDAKQSVSTATVFLGPEP